MSGKFDPIKLNKITKKNYAKCIVFFIDVTREDFEKMLGETQTTKTLRKVRIADADFENPDGSEVKLDIDYSGKKRQGKSLVGPIVDLKQGENHIKVWG